MVDHDKRQLPRLHAEDQVHPLVVDWPVQWLLRGLQVQSLPVLQHWLLRLQHQLLLLHGDLLVQ